MIDHSFVARQAHTRLSILAPRAVLGTRDAPGLPLYELYGRVRLALDEAVAVLGFVQAGRAPETVAGAVAAAPLTPGLALAAHALCLLHSQRRGTLLTREAGVVQSVQLETRLATRALVYCTLASLTLIYASIACPTGRIVDEIVDRAALSAGPPV
jgi:hypothetical protein